jgi:hypothetical protein
MAFRLFDKGLRGFPLNVVKNPACLTNRNVIGVSYFPVGSLSVAVLFSNFQHQFFSEFGVREIAGLSFAAMTVLIHHISGVFFGGSQEQMVRIDTGRVITDMADKHTIRNRAESKLPRIAVGHNLFAASGKFSITPLSSAARKNPAGFRSICRGFLVLYIA